MRLILRVITVGAIIVFLLACWRLSRLQRLGAPYLDLTLKGGIPASLYLPPNGPGFYMQWPLPRSRRPPVVVLLHGFAGDRVGVSTLARRLARNGIAALAIDVHGHGENRNPFWKMPSIAACCAAISSRRSISCAGTPSSMDRASS